MQEKMAQFVGQRKTTPVEVLPAIHCGIRFASALDDHGVDCIGEIVHFLILNPMRLKDGQGSTGGAVILLSFNTFWAIFRTKCVRIGIFFTSPSGVTRFRARE